ncbi:hypothetical protein HOU00_gp167 [Caulobacter phage CcrPW]|uniref:Uncharacterized protein n=1 Tax=Caulobacter phage CcrPW TaxID=2283271 RepID=A0A385EDY7_9CAUD|nr:hypothetical protein HOU00_gp167 [Caulobacter phage CcrPW]AXQ68958.1 hypothetical protein CcrPW_gp419c [Caulobacter phage CcrPW]
MKSENLDLIARQSHAIAGSLRTHGMFYGTIQGEMFDRILDDARVAGVTSVDERNLEVRIAWLIDPTAWIIDDTGAVIEQEHADRALATARAIMQLLRLLKIMPVR